MTISLTINGIEPFTSPKWSLHANARVIDNETLELNATGTYQGSNIEIGVLPNQAYTIKHDTVEKMGVTVMLIDNTGASKYVNGGSLVSGSFVTQSDTKKIRINVVNTQTGKFTFKRPMLYLGTLQGVPYEPKRRERMVEPVVRKNHANTLKLGYNLGTTSKLTDNAYRHLELFLEQGTYYLSVQDASSDLRSRVVQGDGTLLSGVYHEKDFQFTVQKSGIVYVNFRKVDQTDITNNPTVDSWQVMVNKGNSPEPFEPFAVQLNKHAKRPNLQAKRQLFAKR